jgi:hypothetical protein
LRRPLETTTQSGHCSRPRFGETNCTILNPKM